MLRAACALRAAPRACAGSLHRAPLAVARASCPAGSRGSLLRPAARQLSTAAAEEAGLLARGQFDAGFFQGTALFAGVVLGAMAASDEQRASAINGLLAGFRSLGVSDRISDRQLIEDFLRKNVAAAANVVMASPVFYFLFAGITGESVVVSSLRAITGTMRIVPFMGAFYGLFAVCSPFLVDFFMARGQGYEEATGTAGLAMILSGFVAIEAVVELRGCGVLFSQMTAASFAIFIPALIGRLACGVLLQQQKTGSSEEASLLPASWQEGPTWQAHTYMLFDQLHIGQDFAVTTCGTTVFQYILNAVTFVLLTKGRASSLGDMARFMVGGMGGTLGSGMAQFGKTLFMRTGFGFAWNLASSQPVQMPAFDAALARCPA
ncbi:hypothetical protein EMIHUDRAFT_454608 [Emiliania huxleyi CCMP1516]|uniref:Uncharacterized protein n=2 Tax=Emiliania huxleyi TaxID=2903 RepID=A0A0D3KS33_EMIH1|nr:hypothetical protein EMIHUDRAFT_454608 [Emiliania huxleyi CCMP1516]EOD38568.1 hypothetical protein EMIHUDRAFT_454608 [Emiliania huxleyi CCMP1516]|eukprot:XP_005790997.1 hypothetical protein EMIHUDRAFT_454608 [Emiliania huxleyi CCMP1516]